MNQEYQRLFLGGDDVGSTRNSIATYLARPFTRISTSSDQHRILMDDDPESYNRSDYDSDYDNSEDDSAVPLIRDCGYSKPFLFLDMIWNLAFVLVSVFVMLTTIQERPSTPLRLWIGGYALQCLLHMGFVWTEYQRQSFAAEVSYFQSHGVFSFPCICHNRIIKKLESINTILSSIWWVFGFYWIVMGGQPLLQDSPRLYWSSVVFLAFDVFFMIFCIVVACIIFFMLFCCFPILASVAYAMTVGDGASENDIRSLPKFIFRRHNTVFANDKKQEVQLTSPSGNRYPKPELVLPPEDSECCICLYKYMDGVELCTLPCNHHFHHKCITKWLRINATCPLCKFNILRGDMLV